MKTLRFLMPAAACSLFLAPVSRGSLLVYEGFNGYAAGLLNGQTAINTTGLSATAITGGGTLTVNSYDPGGLTFSNLKTSGGGGRFHSPNSGTTNAQSYISYTYNGPTLDGTLYTSYLANIEVAQSTGSVVSLRANTSSSTGSGTSYFVSFADTASGTSGGNQYDASSGTVSGGATLAPGTTYVVIGRFTHVGASLSTTTKGEGTTFILTQDQFDHFKAAGFTDTELETAAIGAGSTEIFARIKDAEVTSGTFNKLTSGCGIQIGIGNAGAGSPQTVRYDEVRYGTSLDEVLPLDPSIPEPEPALVSLTILEATATEPGHPAPSVGKLSINRLDASTRPITVNLGYSGTAGRGADFILPLTATLPANTHSTVIELRPLADLLTEPDETAVITALPGSGYTLAAAFEGTITLKDGPLPTRSRLIENLAAGIPQKIVIFGTSLTASGAWSGQMMAALDASYPGLATLTNSGGSGENSVWGVANVRDNVINPAPNTVFIEFATNDAVIKAGYPNKISPAQARRNLNTIIDSIQAALPNCEIILQVMNPVIGDNALNRANLALCQQNYRDVGRERGFLVIDHMPAWQAVLDQGDNSYLSVVPDGLHPASNGYSQYVTPVILRKLGAPNTLAAGTVMLHAGNQRTAEPPSSTASPRPATLTVTRGGPTTADLIVSLDRGGSASNGSDYPGLPPSVVIPAGSSSVSFEMNPSADGLIEGEETFTLGIAAGAGYTPVPPQRISLVIEDRPFDQWRKVRFSATEWNDPSISGDSADPDHDGIGNLLEFFTGHAPKTADPGGVAVRGNETISGKSYLTLTYNRIPNSGLTGIAETSTDLSQWQSGPANLQETVLSDDGLIQTVTSRSLRPSADTPKQFIRLKVTREP